MKELQDIIAAFEKVKSCGQIAALATVVKVKGSTYRKLGARMLMTQDGWMVGSISGGCLEGDVFDRAQQVMNDGEPIVINYDTTSAQDIVWGLGLGCNGTVDVFIERLSQNDLNPTAFLAECFQHRQVGVLARVFRVEGTVKIGSYVMLHPDGTITNDIADAELTKAILEDAKVTQSLSQSSVKVYQLSTGSAEVFIEAIQPPVQLIIFGAGHDAIPVVNFAKELGWHVTVVDSRPAYATSSRFPLADTMRFAAAYGIALSHPDISDRITINPNTVAVVMTHNYLHDREILRKLLLTPLRYLGLLGPKTRTARLLQELHEEAIVPTAEQLDRLYAPIGIDIGAETPEEIALSIVAEIRTVLANRSGGFLRNRTGSIHSKSAEIQTR